MSNEKLIEDWNTMFVSSPISQQDLANPTEAFLINALLNILNAIYIDIKIPTHELFSGDPVLVRVGKIKLFQYVRDMYKTLTKKKFYYFDLIQPTSKKTSNLLQTLLNYVLYYNMVRDEVVYNSKSVLKKYDQLTVKKANFLKENENNKILAENLKRSVNQLSQELEKLEKQVSSLKESPVLAKYEENTRLQSKQMLKLGCSEIHIVQLKMKVINEDDYNGLKTSIANVKEDLIEKQKAADKLSFNHETLCSEIMATEKKISLLKNVLNLIPEGNIIKPSDLTELKEQYQHNLILYEDNKRVINERKVQVEQIQENINKIRRTLLEITESWNRKCEPLLKSRESVRREIDQLEVAAKKTVTQIDHSRLEKALMEQNAQVGLEALCKSFIKTVDFK